MKLYITKNFHIESFYKIGNLLKFTFWIGDRNWWEIEVAFFGITLFFEYHDYNHLPF